MSLITFLKFKIFYIKLSIYYQTSNTVIVFRLEKVLITSTLTKIENF